MPPSPAQIIAAVSPDAWVALTLGGAFSAHTGAYVPSARQRGDTIELCGRIDGTIGTGGVNVGSVPAAFVPAETVTTVGTISGGAGAAALIVIATSTGVITVGVASGQTNVCLDGITYRLI